MDKHQSKVLAVVGWHLICLQLIGYVLIVLQIHDQVNILGFPDWVMIFWVFCVSGVLALIVNIGLWPERRRSGV